MEIYHRLRALFSKQTSRNPNLIQQGSLFPAKTSPGSISPPDGAITALIFQRIIEDNFRIADLGSGPCGAFWWSQLPKGCSINAFDLYNEPQNTFDYVSFSKKDVTKLHEARKLKGKFHLVVADHIFEHVKAPSGLASSIFHILQPNGYLHVGIPDASNFTDRFYRLIHPDGGGHIQQFTRDSFLKFITAYGFELIEENHGLMTGAGLKNYTALIITRCSILQRKRKCGSLMCSVKN